MPFDPSTYTFYLGEHRDQDVIWISFAKDTDLIANLRKYTKARWSATQKCWYVRDVAQYRDLFGLEQKNIGKYAFSKICPVNQPVFERYRE